MPYSDPLVRKQKAHEAYLRRIQNPDYVLKLNAYQSARAKLPEVKERLKKAHQRRFSDPAYRKKMMDRNAQWSKSNPAYGRAAALNWRNRNLEKARENARKWHKDNRDKRRVYEHEKRARKLAVTVNPRSICIFMSKTKAKAFAVCYYCNKSVSTKRIHFDHIIPLSKGGPHSVENLCVSCSHCNQTKHAKLLKDFVTLGQQLMEL